MVYKSLGAPWVDRGASLALAAGSCMIIWSEATIGSGTSPDLSPFSRATLLQFLSSRV